MTINITAEDSFTGANKKGYDDSEEGFWDTTKGVASANWQYVCHHPYKTTATFVAIAATISLTAAYFLSPAYAAFVGAVGTKAATLVSPAITAVSAFLVAHPLVASLIVVAAVAALIAAPVYAYKNSSKESQIEKVKGAVLDACEKDKDNSPVKDKDGNLKADPNKLSTLMDKVTVVLGLNSEKTVQ